MGLGDGELVYYYEGWGEGVLIRTYCSMGMCGIDWDVYFYGIAWGGCSTLGTNRFDD